MPYMPGQVCVDVGTCSLPAQRVKISVKSTFAAKRREHSLVHLTSRAAPAKAQSASSKADSKKARLEQMAGLKHGLDK